MFIVRLKNRSTSMDTSISVEHTCRMKNNYQYAIISSANICKFSIYLYLNNFFLKKKGCNFVALSTRDLCVDL